jgi:alpha-tubulin suppressor-like RCC1 family protein
MKKVLLTLSIFIVFLVVGCGGLSTTDNSTFETTTSYDGETITSISLGGYHSSAITSEGRVFIWGDNEYGRLGDGTTIDRYTRTEITSQFNLNSGETITSISLGSSHSSALSSTGRVFTWGYNAKGQLGDGTTIDRYTPTEITSQFNLNSGETITSITLGYWNSSALSSTGRVFTWGWNDDGQLGDGTTTNRTTPTEITSQFNFTAGETITSVSLGWQHSSAFTSEGRVFTWGKNDDGQLGDGTTTSRLTPTEITSQFNFTEGETITSISLGGYHSSAITSEGRVFIWGKNEFAQLGDGTTTSRLTPTEITSQFNLNAGETITSISLGSFHSSAITSEGRVFTWGWNDYSQLGDGTTLSRENPTEITSQFNLNAGETITSMALGAWNYSSAITSEGRVFIWGSNYYGQLGDGTTTDRSSPYEISIET